MRDKRCFMLSRSRNNDAVIVSPSSNLHMVLSHIHITCNVHPDAGLCDYHTTAWQVLTTD